MTPITKLTAVALTAMSIAGGVAVAQTAMDPKQSDNPDTANYSISPGSNLKRDASLSAPDKKPADVTSQSATDTSRTWSSTTTTSTTAAAPVAPAEPAPVAAAPVEDTSTTVADSAPAPRADRN